MKTTYRVVAATFTAALCLGALVGCGTQSSGSNGTSSADSSSASMEQQFSDIKDSLNADLASVELNVTYYLERDDGISSCAVINYKDDGTVSAFSITSSAQNPTDEQLQALEEQAEQWKADVKGNEGIQVINRLQDEGADIPSVEIRFTELDKPENAKVFAEGNEDKLLNDKGLINKDSLCTMMEDLGMKSQLEPKVVHHD